MKKQNGITLIALVISIIVMLILAGVSINAVVGDNGIIGKTQEANLLQKYATYLEDLEFTLSEYSMDNIKFQKERINAFNDKVKSYIPSLKDEDIGKIAIIGGNLYLLENKDSLDAKVAEQLAIFVEPNEEITEELAITSIIKNSKEKIGIELKNKEVSSVDWKIVTKISNGNISETYGTGYYYLKAGSDIGQVGVLKNSYLINYNDLNNVTITNVNTTSNYAYTYLDINSTLGITENLILNMDAKSMEKDENGQYNWGNNVILKSTTLSEDEIIADNYINDNKFIFDGTNYIEISNSDGFDFSKGLTLEVFANIKGNTPGEVDGVTAFAPLIGIYKKDVDISTGGLVLRSFIADQNSIFYNLGGASKKWDNGWPNTESSTWNQQLKIDSDSIFNKDIYLSLVISPESYNENENYITQKVYYNGSELGKSYLDVEYWRNFLEYELGTISFAREYITSVANRMNLIGDIYAARIYNNALTEEEVEINYNSTLSYHQNITE